MKNLIGKIVWYYDDESPITRDPVPGVILLAWDNNGKTRVMLKLFRLLDVVNCECDYFASFADVPLGHTDSSYAVFPKHCRPPDVGGEQKENTEKLIKETQDSFSFPEMF
jgi:hypothetical protein